MAVEKYTPLAQITLTSSASSVTFGSIPSGYRDLRIVVEGSPSGNYPLDLEFNGDTTNTNYFNVTAYQNGTASPASFTTNESYTGTNWYSASTREILTIEIMDYSATDKHKTYLSRSGGAGYWIAMAAVRWANTAAITSADLNLRGGSFTSGTTFRLWGVK